MTYRFARGARGTRRARAASPAARSARTTCGPTAPAPAAYKEARAGKLAQPRDDAPRGQWWESLRRSGARRARGAGRCLEPDAARRRGALPRSAGRDAVRGARAELFPRRRCERGRHARARRRASRGGGTAERATPRRLDIALGGRPVGRDPAQRRGERRQRRRRAPPISPARAVGAGAARAELLPAARRWTRIKRCCQNTVAAYESSLS